MVFKILNAIRRRGVVQMGGMISLWELYCYVVVIMGNSLKSVGILFKIYCETCQNV